MSSDCLQIFSLFAYTIVVYSPMHRLLLPSLSELQRVKFPSPGQNGYFQMVITFFLQMWIEFSMGDSCRVFHALLSYEIYCFQFLDFHEQIMMDNVYLTLFTLWVLSIFLKVILKESLTFFQ